MAMLLYDRFYRRHGIRLPQQLPNPPVSIYSELVLPKNSVFHWFGYDHSEKVGLDQSDQIAKGVDRFIFAENVEHYIQEDIRGNPRNLPLITSTMTRNYFTENKKVKRLKMPLGDVKDERSLIVYNYGLLNDKYLYTGSITKELDRWLNYHRTVYKTIARLTKESNRQHFLEIDVPVVIPPLTSLLIADEGLKVNVLRRLSTMDDWQTSEIFNLITNGLNTYIFKDIAEDPEAQAKINIIFKCNNEYTVMNLGKLFSFTLQSGDSDEGPRLRIAKRYLKAMMYMRQMVSGGMDGTMGVSQGEIRKPLADEIGAIINERDSNDGYEEDEGENIVNRRVQATTNRRVGDSIVDEDDDDIDTTVVESPVKAHDPFNPTKKTVSKAKSIDELDKAEIDEEDTIDSDIDRELEELESVYAGNDDDLSSYVEYIAPSSDPKIKIEARAREFVEVGLMSPAELTRVKRMAEKVDAIPDPRDSTKKLTKSMVITADELAVDEGVELVSDKVIGVTDVSMKHSTLNKFDKEYIDETLDKDVAQMALSLQKAGILVLDYKVDRVKDIVNDYEIHRIKVQPVGGKESTISFKLPKVTSEGTFTVGGTTNRMRKQRGDKHLTISYV